MIEPLEPRRLFSASLHEGVLHVSGTAGNDAISFARAGDEIHAIVNGERTAFDAAAVWRISVWGGAGDDRIVIGRWRGRTMIRGGDGDDTISGGRGDDLIFGDAGADAIYALSGDDWMDPGHVYSTVSHEMAGDGEADAVSGGVGDDVVQPPDPIDAVTGVETTEADGETAPTTLLMRPDVAFYRQGARTFARVTATLPNPGYVLDLVDVHRHGRTITITVQPRAHRAGGWVAVLVHREQHVDLGRLPDGPFRVRIVDRWGGAARSDRFVAPLPEPPTLRPGDVRAGVEVDGRQAQVRIDWLTDRLRPQYWLTPSSVARDGREFSVDLTPPNPPSGSIIAINAPPWTLSLGELRPGTYSFAVTSGGTVIERVAFRVR